MPSTSHGPFARRYAGVLFEVVEPRGETTKALEDLQALAATFAESADLREVFESPAVPLVKKHAVIDAVAAQMGVSDAVRRLLGLMADRDRLSAIDAVREAFLARVNAARRQVEADVVTATPLTDDRRAALAQALGRAADCQVTIKERVDPSIIGGVVARVGSLVFDGSVVRQIERLRDQLASGGSGGQ